MRMPTTPLAPAMKMRSGSVGNRSVMDRSLPGRLSTDAPVGELELAVTPQTMNALVHQLVKRSLLERRDHPTHAKVVVLHLSRRGRRLLDHATPAVRAIEHAALDEINDHDAQVVNTWLARVGERFSQQRLH